MNITIHEVNGTKAAELISDEMLIQNAQQGLDLLANLYYQDFDTIIMYEKHIIPAFFDLKTGLAGDILQKFSNYRVRLFIIGDFTKYPGNSIHDFITESNKHSQVNFVDSVAQAMEKSA